MCVHVHISVHVCILSIGHFWFVFSFQIRTARANWPPLPIRENTQREELELLTNHPTTLISSTFLQQTSQSITLNKVCEEKEDPLAVRREEGGGRRRKEERGRTKQRMSLEEQGTSAQDETSSRVQTQPVKRGKASLPVREWDSIFYGVWSIHVFIADSIEVGPGLHHHLDFLHER